MGYYPLAAHKAHGQEASDRSVNDPISAKFSQSIMGVGDNLVRVKQSQLRT